MYTLKVTPSGAFFYLLLSYHQHNIVFNTSIKNRKNKDEARKNRKDVELSQKKKGVG
jgi:hypothetical protein